MEEEIYDLIPEKKFISRKDLIELTGLKDRVIRDIISNIRKEHSIISLTSGKGYMKSSPTNEMTKEEMEYEYSLIKKQIAESNSRIKSIKKNLRTPIARMKILEKEISKCIDND